LDFPIFLQYAYRIFASAGFGKVWIDYVFFLNEEVVVEQFSQSGRH